MVRLRKNKRKNKLALLALGGLLVLLVSISLVLSKKSSLPNQDLASSNIPSSETKQEQQAKDKPVFLSGSVEPKKVAPGDIVTVTAEIQDIYGITQVKADMGAIAFIELKLISGTVKQGTWQGTWKAFDTKPQHYQTTVFADNIQGKQSQMTINWEDPTITDSFTDETKIAASSNMTVSGNAVSLSVIPWACGDNLVVSHTAGVVAPVTVEITYGTVSTALTGATKCWITRNLGATTQAGSATDNTDASAGWYWQFNRKQGYAVGPTPAWTITSNSENSNWTSANDPCTIELGTGWRLPTDTEWTNADANGQTGGWDGYAETYADVLKIHVAGYLSNANGSLGDRGSIGYYWSSVQHANNSYGYYVYITSNSVPGAESGGLKATGMSVRCLKD